MWDIAVKARASLASLLFLATRFLIALASLVRHSVLRCPRAWHSEHLAGRLGALEVPAGAVVPGCAEATLGGGGALADRSSSTYSLRVSMWSAMVVKDFSNVVRRATKTIWSQSVNASSEELTRGRVE